MTPERNRKSEQSANKVKSVTKVRYDITLISDDDLYLFNEGTHHRLYEKLGAHPMTINKVSGTYFAVWAPNAREVCVIGDFNSWDRSTHQLKSRGRSGIWEGFIVGVDTGTIYKYHITSRYHNYQVEKADPFAFFNEMPPKTASVVSALDYKWGDQAWMKDRHGRSALDTSIAIYEVHLGSWRRVIEDNNRYLTYREMAVQLVEYIQKMGYTHVEFLPVMEHPFYGSWGYQTTGYFPLPAATEHHRISCI